MPTELLTRNVLLKDKDGNALLPYTDKQDALVSGTNIKTVNNQSLLGAGNISIAGGITYSAGTGISISNNTISTVNMQTTTNLVTSVSSSSTDSQYPSAKCLYDIIGDIETILHNINSGS